VVVRHLRQAAGAPDPAVTDAQLLERFLRDRDGVAFELLVRRHERLVQGVCRRVLRNPHDADDAFQTTFLLLVRKAGSIARREALPAWLHQVAYRVALRANGDARRDLRRSAPGVEPDSLPSREPDPAEALPPDLGPVLDQELSRLPEKYRAAVALCFLEGCTHEEAAQRLGCPRGTVSTWLTRARALLRARLARRGVVLTAAALAAGLGPPAGAAPVAAAVRVALRWVEGGPAAAQISARVAALAEGVLRTMFLTKLNVAAAALLAAALVTSGGTLAVRALAGGGQDPGATPLPGAQPTGVGLPFRGADGPSPAAARTAPPTPPPRRGRNTGGSTPTRTPS
jgi:RNA polymerase sigma factor (sigma-70 family)